MNFSDIFSVHPPENYLVGKVSGSMLNYYCNQFGRTFDKNMKKVTLEKAF